MSEKLGDAIGRTQDRPAILKGKNLVPDWKLHIPEYSHWHPGDVGDPFCRTCLGTGWVRQDLPVWHKDFGHLLLCDCTAPEIKRKWEAEQVANRSGRHT